MEIANVVIGYKCFKKGLINQSGISFEEGKTYSKNEQANNGMTDYDFLVYSSIEDALRFFSINDEVDICRVIGFGDKTKHSDDFYGYYDMNTVEYLHIAKHLSRPEVIQIAVGLNSTVAPRFFQSFRLTPEEITLFKEIFKGDPNVIKTIQYYQEHDLEAFSRKRTPQK